MIHVLRFLKGIIFGLVVVCAIAITTFIGLLFTGKTPDLAVRLCQELSDDLFN